MPAAPTSESTGSGGEKKKKGKKQKTGTSDIVYFLNPVMPQAGLVVPTPHTVWGTVRDRSVNDVYCTPCGSTSVWTGDQNPLLPVDVPV